jgi:hypothetical protein
MALPLTLLLDDQPDVVDFGPPLSAEPCGELGVYVMTELLAARRLFVILGDPFVQDRIDDHPWVLDELACDPMLRGLFGGAVVEEAVHMLRRAA